MADLSTTKLIDLDDLSTYNDEVKKLIAKCLHTVVVDSSVRKVYFYTEESKDVTVGTTTPAFTVDLSDIDTTIGKLSDLTTTVKTSIVAAINELDGELGTITPAAMGTTASTVSGAIKEHNDLLTGADTVTGTVANKIKTAIEALDTTTDVTIASEASGVVTIKAGIKEEDGVIAQGTGTDITLAKVATTGTAADVAIVDAESKITATNVEDALTELAKAVETGGSGSVVYLDKNSAPDTGYAATYVLSQGKDASGNKKEVGRIQIPLDYLVKSATVKTCTTKDDPVSGLNVGDKYIDFTVNVKEGTATDEHLYIAVKDMVTEVTVASGATEVQLALSSSNEMSATLVDGGVATAKLADNAVTTAKITDANVTAAKLATDAVETAKIKDANVTAAKLAADSIVCTVTSGTVASSTMDSVTVGLLQKAEDAVQESDITLATAAEVKALFS